LAIACRNRRNKTHIRITEKAVRMRSGFLLNTIYRTLLNRVCMYSWLQLCTHSHMHVILHVQIKQTHKDSVTPHEDINDKWIIHLLQQIYCIQNLSENINRWKGEYRCLWCWFNFPDWNV